MSFEPRQLEPKGSWKIERKGLRGSSKRRWCPAHRSVPSLRFPRTPLPPTSHIALTNTASDGDVIDNPGCVEKRHSTLRQVAMNCSDCIAIFLRKDTVPDFFGFGFHLCLQILSACCQRIGF